MEIILDEGYMFGLGIFETIAVENGKPLFLQEHLRRMEKSAEFLSLGSLKERGITPRSIEDYLSGKDARHHALKIMLSKENMLMQIRKNTYTEEQYEKGFHIDFSKIKRNETSPLIYHKTMNYGDCILEKRQAAKEGLDEKLFLNTKGEISEGTISNVFFVKDNSLYTPSLECGLLPGIVREYICRNMRVLERKIYPQEIYEFDECFVTNSLMGIMPVTTLADMKFQSRKITDHIRKKYQEI